MLKDKEVLTNVSSKKLMLKLFIIVVVEKTWDMINIIDADFHKDIYFKCLFKYVYKQFI